MIDSSRNNSSSSSGSNTKSIMVVEDDPSLSEWICDYLVSHGYEVTLSNRGDLAVEMIHEDIPDLVLLDINLPGMDGFEVCQAVRGSFQNPILMLTARTEEIDEVLGLELGANDYLAKPVRPRILLARIKALLRNNELRHGIKIRQIGCLKIDLKSKTVELDGAALDLSLNEFDALLLLSEHVGEIVSRDSLMQRIRRLDYDGTNRSVDIMISRLRKKLNDDSTQPRRIKTARGKGYWLTADSWGDS